MRLGKPLAVGIAEEGDAGERDAGKGDADGARGREAAGVATGVRDVDERLVVEALAGR